MALENLDIRISADTADFIAGAEGVESQLGDLSSEAIQTAGALEILSNRADDAGDNISQAGRRATTTAGQFSALTGATNATNTSFLGLSATTWGSLIPAVVALGAALAPVVGALGGFVAVAGSIGAVGLLPVIGAIATDTEVLRERFNEIVQTIRSEFAPVFDMATGTLLALMDTFEDVIPALVPANSALSQIARAFERVGTTIINALPEFVELAVSLTQEFLPPFSRFLQDILPELPGMIQGFVDVFSRMIPRFQEAGSTLMEILPPFTEFGFTVLNVLGPAMARFFEVGTQALEFLNGLSPAVQKSVAALSLLAPVAAVVGKLFSGPILAAGGALASLLAGPFIGALSTMAGVIPTVVGSLVAIAGVTANVLSFFIPFSGAITGVIGTLGGLVSSAAGVISTLGTIAALIGTGGIIVVAIAAAIAAFVRFQDEIRAVFDRVLPIISGAVNSAINWLRTEGASLAQRGMRVLGSAIRTALIEVRNIIFSPSDSVIVNALRDLSQWLQANGPGLLRNAWDALVEVSLAAWRGFKEGLIGNSIIPDTISDVVSYLQSTGISALASVFATVASVIIAPFESAFNRVFNLVGSGVNMLIGMVNNILGTLPSQVTSQLGFEQVDPISFEERQTDVGAIASRRQEQINQRIEVVVEGDTDVIRDVSTQVVNEESRAARRNTGTPSGVR